jgi:hypothetical protein
MDISHTKELEPQGYQESLLVRPSIGATIGKYVHYVNEKEKGIA